jgi:hypothetical protein
LPNYNNNLKLQNIVKDLILKKNIFNDSYCPFIEKLKTLGLVCGWRILALLHF